MTVYIHKDETKEAIQWKIQTLYEIESEIYGQVPGGFNVMLKFRKEL